MFRSCVIVFACVAVIATVATAQEPTITNSTNVVVVGGAGGLGCQGFDPPALTNNLPASATAEFSYDAGTGLLTLVVENTSQVLSQLFTPSITAIWFNVPHLAVSGMTLVSQSTSAPGSPAPAFAMSVDTDLFTAPNTNSVNCVGEFGVALTNTGAGPNGAIANASATQLAGSAVTGPVTFVFQVAGANLGSLSAGAFSNSFSQNGSLSNANVAMKFQGGGGAGAPESGVLANGPGCEPGAWVPTTVEAGQLVTFVQSGAPGCFGCIIGSLNPGPTPVGNALLPIGVPFIIISSAINPPTSITTTEFVVPPWVTPGLTVYCTLVMADPGLQNVTFSDQFVITVI